MSQDASECGVCFMLNTFLLQLIKLDFSNRDGDRELYLDRMEIQFVLVGICTL